MAVRLDRLTEAGRCRLQGRSAGAPAHLPSRTALGRGDDAKMGEGHAFRTLWTRSNERRERNHVIKGGVPYRGLSENIYHLTGDAREITSSKVGYPTENFLKTYII